MNKQVIDFLKNKGLKIEQPANIDAELRLWREWYVGNVPGFHKYKVYQGKKTVQQTRKSLGMGETVCQDWADLTITEKVAISCSDKRCEEKLDQILKVANFFTAGNQLLERSFALGGGFFIEYFDGEKVNIKYVTQDRMIPITFKSGALIEAAFTSEQIIGGQPYEYIEVHTLDNNNEYVIDNYLLANKNKKLVEVSKDFYQKHKLLEKFETHSKTPKFQMVKPNKARKNDPNNPYGVSVFSGAIDVLKSIDNEYDSLDNEFTLGRKRVFVSDGVARFNVDPNTGETLPVFDPNDTAFYRLPDDNSGNELPIIESNMQLRVTEHEAALQTQLNLLGQKCGFGENHYKWNQGNVTTATQIISENSKEFRTLRKHEILLNAAIVTMSRALLEMQEQFIGDITVPDDLAITVDFDDSIIEDTTEKRQMALTDYNAELISAQEYYRRVYGFDDKKAEQYAKQMQDERNAELAWRNIEEEPPQE